MRKLEALCLLATPVVGCGPSAHTETTPHPLRIERRVARRDVVSSFDGLVARGYAAGRDFNATLTPPFFVLVNEEGWSCLVDARTYARVRDDESFSCRWTAKR